MIITIASGKGGTGKTTVVAAPAHLASHSRRADGGERRTAMIDRNALREAILARLSTIIDPETGVDVMRMRLIEDLAVDERGVARYTFRPSSPLCPMAVSLALSIRQTVGEVEGVTGQEIGVVGYVGAAELNAMLREMEMSAGG